MSVPFKFLCLTLALLLQIDEGTSLMCFYCNTRDNLGCDHLQYGDNNSYGHECGDGPCSTIKGQWGYGPGDRKVMLWRGCSKVSLCTQASGMCCHCNKDLCNFGNECFNRGQVLVPGIIVISAQILIFLTNLAR